MEAIEAVGTGRRRQLLTAASPRHGELAAAALGFRGQPAVLCCVSPIQVSVSLANLEPSDFLSQENSPWLPEIQILTFLHFLSLLTLDPFDLNTKPPDSDSDFELGLFSGLGTMLTSFFPLNKEQ